MNIVPYLLVACQVLLVFAALVFFVSGLDDFLIDVVHGIRSAYRRLFVYRTRERLTEEQLLSKSEQPVAIMIPAWHEDTVIASMIDNLAKTVNYANYQVFVGCYPNDPATQRAVETVRATYDNVHRLVCPKDGPTNKADCLNWVFLGIQRFESEHGVQFAAFVLHDAEDVVHPLSLKLYNYLIPRKGMVQLPVFPLVPRWYQFTAGHYIDEFAEHHTKDLVVRERLGKTVPCAGVVCAFSRAALLRAAEKDRNQVFNVSSLTEDYEFGIRLQEFDVEQVFVNQAIERVRTFRSRVTGRQRVARVREYIATRELFPETFRDAVKQKGRWVTGIALQGWSNLGWPGGIGGKYMLFRDRKSLLTNQVNMLGYGLLLVVLLLTFQEQLFPASYRQRSILPPMTWFWYVLVADTFFLIVRFAQRAASVHRVYGAGQALLSVPRFLWSNVINFTASIRAIFRYIAYLRTGEMIPWEKTEHAFPTAEQLSRYHRRLGDLLIERRIIRLSDLDEALAIQKVKPRPLGAILVDLGYAEEDKLVQVLGVQLGLLSKEVDPYEVDPALLGLIPKRLAIRHSLFPVEITEKNELLVATDRPPVPAERQQIEEAIDPPVKWCLATRGDVAFAIRRGFERLAAGEPAVRSSKLLGRELVSQNLLTEAQLKEALKEQRSSYGRLGACLVELGLLTGAALERALGEYEGGGYFGEFLVRRQYLRSDQIQEGLALQRGRSRTLGQVLVTQGVLTRSVIDQIAGLGGALRH